MLQFDEISTSIFTNRIIKFRQNAKRFDFHDFFGK